MAKRGSKQSKVDARRHTLQPTLIAVAVSMALAAPAAQAEWTSTVDLFVKPGNKRSYGGVDALVPISQDGKSLFFADLKANLGSSGTHEFNIGGGYRFLSNDEKWAYGFYGAWDRRRSERDNDFDQLTVGAEMRGEKFDLRANYYYPITDKEYLGGLGGTSHFSQHNVYRNGIYEEAMEGFDVEVGMLLPVSESIETRAYLAGYTYEGEDVAPRANGVRARIEARLNRAYSVGASIRNDDEFGTASFLELRYSLGKNASQQGIRSVTERMAEPWTRDIDVIISDPTESSSPGDAFLVEEYEGQVVHIDSSNPLGGPGDGTYEDPYVTTGDCEDEKCGDETSGLADYTLVRLWQGDSESSAYDGIALVDGQTLWGEGIDIFNGRVYEDRYPIIADDVGVVLAEDSTVGNTVAGVEIEAYYAGILGYNTFGTVNLHHNNIFSAGYAAKGIFLVNEVGTGQSGVQTASITDNQIFGASKYGGGVVVENYADSGSLSQTVTVSGNTIISIYGSGVVLDNEANFGGSINQTATVSDNIINVYGYTNWTPTGPEGTSGVLLYNRAGYEESAGTVNQTVTVSGNSINTEEKYPGSSYGSYGSYGGIGIASQNHARYQGSLVSQNLTVADNTVERAKYGMSIGNYAQDSGVTMQHLTVSGNSVTADYDGVIIANKADNVGIATSTLTMTDNSVTSVYYGDAVSLQNKGGFGGTANLTATVSDNTLTTGEYGGDGLELQNDAVYDSSTNVSLILSGNTIDAYDDGVFIDNYVHGGSFYNDSDNSSATMDLTISGNSIEAGSEGVDLESYTHNYSTSVITMDVSGNNIMVDEDGVDLDIDTGRYSSSVITATVTGNTIDAGEDGIDPDSNTYEYSSNVMNLTVSGNDITAEYDAVQLRDNVYDYSTSNFLASVLDNTLDAGDDGVNLDGYDDYAYDSSSANLTLNVSGNSITAGDDGVYVQNKAGDDSQSTQLISVTNNTIEADYTGVEVNNKTGYSDEYQDANQTVTINDNDITVGHYGIRLHNEAFGMDYGYGTAVQNAFVNGNTITADDQGYEGIRIVNDDDYDYDNEALQTVVTSNNQIGGFYWGVYAHNQAADDDSVQNVTVTGATVSSTAGGDAYEAVVKCNEGSYQNVNVSSTTLDGAPVAGAFDNCP